MSVYETNHQVPLGSVATLRVINVFERAYDAVLDWRSRRETRRVLSGLSDAQLADVGLRRENIYDAVTGLNR